MVHGLKPCLNLDSRLNYIIEGGRDTVGIQW